MGFSSNGGVLSTIMNVVGKGISLACKAKSVIINFLKSKMGRRYRRRRFFMQMKTYRGRKRLERWFASGLVNAVSNAASSVGSAISSGVSSVGSAIGSAASNVGGAIVSGAKNIGSAAMSDLKSAGSSLLSGAKYIGGKIVSGAKAVGNAVLSGATAIFNGVFHQSSLSTNSSPTSSNPQSSPKLKNSLSVSPKT